MSATILQAKSQPSTSHTSSQSESLCATSSPVEAAVYFHDSTDTRDSANDDPNGDAKPKARSRLGCFTCRKRKKRCDEGKPVCLACMRLKLDCTYPLPGQERKNKKRKASFDGVKDDNDALNNARETSEPDSSLSANGSPHTERSLFVPKGPSSVMPKKATATKKLKLPNPKPNKTTNDDKEEHLSSPDAIDSTNPESATFEAVSSQITRPSNDTSGSSPSFAFTQLHSYLDSTSGQYENMGHKPGCSAHPEFDGQKNPDQDLNSLLLNEGLSPFSAVSPPAACTCSHKSSPQDNNSYSGHSQHNNESDVPYILQTGFHDTGLHDKPNAVLNTRIRNLPSPDPGLSPSAVFARGLHSLMASPRPEQSPRIREVDDEGKYTHSCDSLQKTPLSFFDAAIDINGFHSPPNFYDSSHEHFFLGSPEREFTMSPLVTQPTPWYATHLDSFGIEMFHYYRTSLAEMICVSRGNFNNSFVDVFIPMAEQDPAVLYAIVAYGSFHNSMGKHEGAGMRYLNKAIELVRQDLPKGKLTTLACILLIATAEICRGDMIHWDKHLEAAAAVIKMNGGLKCFVGNRTKRWLASNFFYHEILGASRNSRKTHFKAVEYDELMRSDIGVHSLIGCCKSIFHLMARLSDLAVESQAIFEKLEGDDEASEMFYSTELRTLHMKAKALEDEIDRCKPDPTDIMALSSEDQEEQLTLFDTFQLTAKLQLQQCVLRRNAASLNMQVLAADLVESLDVVLNTKVEGLLVLPIFMASIMAIRPRARMAMLDRFEAFYKRNLARNIIRAQSLAEQVWNLDCNGTKYVNWPSLIQSQGMDICFA